LLALDGIGVRILGGAVVLDAVGGNGAAGFLFGLGGRDAGHDGAAGDGVGGKEDRDAGAGDRAGFGPGWPHALGKGLREERFVSPTGDEVDRKGVADGSHEGAAIEAGGGPGVLWGKAEDTRVFYAIGPHLGDYVDNVGMPVAHGYVDFLAKQFAEHLALKEGPAGEGRAFGEWFLAKADFGVTMLKFFDDGIRHGASAGDLLQVLGHLAELVGRAVSEQENGGALAGIFSTHLLRGPQFVGGVLLDPLDNLNDVVDGGSGNDAMAEVEDMTGAAVGEGKDFADAGLEDIEGGEEGDGVEVPLNSAAGAYRTPAFVEGNPPVETEDVRCSFGHGGEHGGGVDSKVNDGDAEGLDALNELGGGGEAVLPVVGDREGTDPGVEDLDAVGASFHLLLRVGYEDSVELIHEERPCSIVRVHHLLGFDVVARTAAFDHVAGEGEGSATEADDAEAVAVRARSGEVRGNLFDGPGDVAEFVRAIGVEGLDLLEGADRGVNLGTFAGDELEVEAHGGKGEEEVGEDDGGVDVEALGGGDGDFGGDVGSAADVEQGVMLAHGHVLGHIAAGLAEEPDGGAIHGLAEAGAHEAAAALGVQAGIDWVDANF
jgi:hypothetical protein